MEKGFQIKNIKEKLKDFMHNSVIMQWDNIRKTILVLTLGGADFIIWFAWLVYSYHSPSFNQWIHSDHYSFFFYFYLFGAFVYFILIFLCYRFRNNCNFKRYMPFVAIAYFGVSMLMAGFAIGISSPTTIAGYITVVTVGLILYERKIIYSTFLPGTVVLLILIVLCGKGLLAYAPVFSAELDAGDLYQNSFWVYSMLLLYAPIFLASMVLFEVLLIQWKYREKWIQEMSRRDHLTGIYNRRTIGEFLKELETQHRVYAIILLDLDYFKKINDNYGHDVGDQVLMTVSNILSDIALEQDCLGRYGGEEFMLILPQVSKDQALLIAEVCRKAIAEAKVHTNDGQLFNISASFGVALSTANSKKEDIIRMADQALYIAKEKGRNQVYFNH